MKVAVIGAGALGCLFGAKFSQENEVIMIAHKQSEADVINDYGLILKATDDKLYQYKNVKAFVSGTYKQQVDVVVILVKTIATKEALQQNQFLIGEKTLVLTLKNGLGNYEILAEYAKDTKIVLGTTNHNSVLLEEGKVFHSGEGITSIGGKNVSAEDLQKIYHLFEVSGLSCEIVDNIHYLIWKKLFINLAINAFTYITLTPIGFIGQNEYALNIIEKIILEAAQVAKADGCDFDGKKEFENVIKIAAAHKMGYSSMTQDRKKNSRTEIDAINGAVVNLAKIYNLKTPYNEMITDLVHAIEDADVYNKNLRS